MTNEKKEQKCIQESKDFIDRASKDVGSNWPLIVVDMKFNSATIMIGQLAAEQFKTCMAPEAIPVATPNPTPRKSHHR